jgi:hypothetical protein
MTNKKSYSYDGASKKSYSYDGARFPAETGSTCADCNLLNGPGGPGSIDGKYVMASMSAFGNINRGYCAQAGCGYSVGMDIPQSIGQVDGKEIPLFNGKGIGENGEEIPLLDGKEILPIGWEEDIPLLDGKEILPIELSNGVVCHSCSSIPGSSVADCAPHGCGHEYGSTHCAACASIALSEEGSLHDGQLGPNPCHIHGCVVAPASEQIAGKIWKQIAGKNVPQISGKIDTSKSYSYDGESFDARPFCGTCSELSGRRGSERNTCKESRSSGCVDTMVGCRRCQETFGHSVDSCAEHGCQYTSGEYCEGEPAP